MNQNSSTYTLKTENVIDKILPAGAIIDGTYRVISVIGRGGMGTVYRVEDVKLRCNFSLKVINDTYADENDQRAREERFKREFRVMASIRHPSVVPVFRAGRDEASGILYYVMPDYVLKADVIIDLCRRVFRCPQPGGWDGVSERPMTVADLVDGKRTLPEDVAAEIGLSVLAALEAIHGSELHVAHRDIKPSNLIIDNTGSVLVLDFGIAKAYAPGSYSTLTMRGAVAATPLFASPEQLLGSRGSVGPATDYYSLGLVLFRILTGGLPSRDFADLPKEISRRLSSRWQILLRNLLEPDPAARLQDPSKAREILESIVVSYRRRRYCRKLLKYALPILSVCAVCLALFHGVLKSQPETKTAVPGNAGASGNEGAQARTNAAVRAKKNRKSWEEMKAEVNDAKRDSLLYSLDIIRERFTRYNEFAGGTFPREPNSKGGYTVEIPAGRTAMYFDMNLGTNDTIFLNGGRLVFALPKPVCDEFADKFEARMNDVITNSAAVDVPGVEANNPLDSEHAVVWTAIEIGEAGGELENDHYDPVYVMRPFTLRNRDSRPEVKVTGVGFSFYFQNPIPEGLKFSGIYAVSEMVIDMNSPRARESGEPVCKDIRWVEPPEK